VVGPDESEKAATGNGESETSAGTHPQARTYQERAGLCFLFRLVNVYVPQGQHWPAKILSLNSLPPNMVATNSC